MNVEWHYDGYYFNLEIKELRRQELDIIIDFLENLVTGKKE